MNLLFVGGGQGSWDIRGKQLGEALGARVTSEPSQADWRWADLAVLVKRHGARHAASAKAVGCRVVWDALDCWRQPWDNGQSPNAARAALVAQVDAIGPVSVIGATQAQADVVGGSYLPHHSWPGLVPVSPCRELRVVAYQGNASYLGTWARRLTVACAARGMAFEINPSDLRRADLIVSLREGPWDGWICREWKSGVKIVNAIAAGRPVLTQDTAAARELGAPGSIIETPADLEAALDAWTPYAARAAAAGRCADLAERFTLSVITEQYRRILETVSTERATTCTGA